MKAMTRIEAQKCLAEIIERTTRMEAQIAKLLAETSEAINKNLEGRSPES